MSVGGNGDDEYLFDVRRSMILMAAMCIDSGVDLPIR